MCLWNYLSLQPLFFHFLDAAHYPGQRIHGQFLVRAYPFIEGVTLSNTVPANSTQIFYELGKSLAKFHITLEVNMHIKRVPIVVAVYIVMSLTMWLYAL